MSSSSSAVPSFRVCCDTEIWGVSFASGVVFVSGGGGAEVEEDRGESRLALLGKDESKGVKGGGGG